MIHRPSQNELSLAPELGHVVVVLAALDALEDDLKLQHTTLEEFDSCEVETIRRALEVLYTLRPFRTALRRYRSDVLRHVRACLRPPNDTMIF